MEKNISSTHKCGDKRKRETILETPEIEFTHSLHTLPLEILRENIFPLLDYHSILEVDTAFTSRKYREALLLAMRGMHIRARLFFISPSKPTARQVQWLTKYDVKATAVTIYLPSLADPALAYISSLGGNLEELSVYGSYATPFAKLFSSNMLHALSGLQSISLQFISLRNVDIANMYVSCPSITKIELIACTLEDNAVSLIASRFPLLEELRVQMEQVDDGESGPLRVSQVPITDALLDTIANSCPQLQLLDISNTEWETVYPFPLTGLGSLAAKCWRLHTLNIDSELFQYTPRVDAFDVLRTSTILLGIMTRFPSLRNCNLLPLLDWGGEKQNVSVVEDIAGQVVNKLRNSYPSLTLTEKVPLLT